MNKNSIIGVVFLLIVIALGGFKYYEYKHPEAFPKEEVAASTSVSEERVSSVAPSHNETTSSINIVTDRPINGTYKGVIEVGASGFNCFVVSIDANKNWELVYKEFGESLAYEGFMTTDDVQLGLKKYLSKIFEKGVAGRNVHFVMSSGALKNKKTSLIADAITKMGYVVNKVTADQEGKYALKALLPKSYRDSSFTVDIGSGNTKVTYYKNGTPISIEAPGAKYYQDGKSDESVASDIKKAMSEIPESSKQYCFIIGGVPYQLAKETKTGDERFTKLNHPDDYSAGDNAKLKAGLNIYRSLYENSGCQTYVFDWDANFTIGFLLTLN